MTGRDWKRIGPWLERLVDLPPAERERLLQECDDEALAAELRELLEEEERDTGFLTPPAEVDGRPPADRVGPYELVRRLGTGGMGEVWLGRREGDFEQEVAIKFVRAGAGSKDVFARFLRERQLLASLDHPGIARLVDGGALPDGRPYLVLEYVDGQPLDRHCAEKKVDVRARLALLLDVLDAVESAHRRLVVHRDLKPSNILVDRDGRVRLLDFGIAKLLEDGAESGRTRTDALPMTPRYASPEQVEGRPVSTASDVYSLGVLAYELICGRSPYGDTATSMALVRAVSETDPSPPGTVFRSLSEVERRALGLEHASRTGVDCELDWIVMTALRKDPERRYASVAKMADDLRRYLAGHPVLAGPDSWSYRASKFVMRNRWAVAGAAAAVLALVVGALASLTSAAQARRFGEQEREARRVSQGVVAFMTEIFSSANPQAGGSRDVGLIDAFDRAAALAPEIPDPVVRFAVLLNIASVRMGLAQYDLAEPLARECLAIARENAIPPRDVVQARNALALALRETGQDEEAAELFESALLLLDDADERNLAIRDDSPQDVRLTLLMNLAGAVEDEEPERAFEIYQEVLEGRLALNGPDSRDTLVLRFNLGGLLIEMGCVDEAYEELHTAHEAFREMGDEAVFEAAVTAYGMAVADLLAGRPEQALVLVLVWTPVAEDLFGRDSDWTAQMRLTTAWAYLELGRIDEAVTLADELIASDVLNVEHTFIAEWVRARCLVQRGEVERALEVLGELFDQDDSLPEVDATTTALVQLELAKCHEALGRNEEALAWARSAADVWARHRCTDLPSVRESRQLVERLQR